MDHAYKTYDNDDIEVRLDFDLPGYLALTVGGHRRRVHVDELEAALVGRAPLPSSGLDTDDHLSIRSIDDGAEGVAFEASCAIGVPAVVARLDEEEVALMCEWLTELTELDWEI